MSNIELLLKAFDPFSYSNLMRRVVRNEDGTISPLLSNTKAGVPESGDCEAEKPEGGLKG